MGTKARVGLTAATALGSVLMGAWLASGRLIRRRMPDPAVDPGVYGLDADPVRFPSRDGLLLGGFWIPARRRRGTVLLLPGQGGSLDPDLRHAPALVQHGYDVLIFDWRAHGRSQGRYVTWGCAERMDLLGALDFLRQREITRVGVLGFSMGAAVAFHAALEGEGIAAIISDGCYTDLDAAARGWLATRGLDCRASELFVRLVVKMASWRVGCDLTAAAPLRWVRQIAPRPLLFIQGDQDPFVSPQEFERLWQAAPEPKERWLVPGAGHREADKLYPAAYRQHVLDFFDRHLASSSGRRTTKPRPASGGPGGSPSPA